MGKLLLLAIYIEIVNPKKLSLGDGLFPQYAFTQERGLSHGDIRLHLCYFGCKALILRIGYLAF